MSGAESAKRTVGDGGQGLDQAVDSGDIEVVTAAAAAADPYLAVIGDFGRWQLLLLSCQMLTTVVFIQQVLVNKFLAYKDVTYACADTDSFVTAAHDSLGGNSSSFCGTEAEAAGCANWTFSEEPFQVGRFKKFKIDVTVSAYTLNK